MLREHGGSNKSDRDSVARVRSLKSLSTAVSIRIMGETTSSTHEGTVETGHVHGKGNFTGTKPGPKVAGISLVM